MRGYTSFHIFEKVNKSILTVPLTSFIFFLWGRGLSVWIAIDAQREEIFTCDIKEC